MRDAEYRPLDNAKVALKITLPDGGAITLDAEPEGREAGLYATTYVTRQPGAHRVVATANSPDGATVGERETGWAAQPAADEFARLTPDRDFLATLAAKTGGEVVDGDRLDVVRRQPALAQGTHHRAVDLAALAQPVLLLDRHRLPLGRMGSAPREWPGLMDLPIWGKSLNHRKRGRTRKGTSYPCAAMYETSSNPSGVPHGSVRSPGVSHLVPTPAWECRAGRSRVPVTAPPTPSVEEVIPKGSWERVRNPLPRSCPPRVSSRRRRSLPPQESR